jgi:hypothetical protein
MADTRQPSSEGPANQRPEWRDVVVHEPALSDDANAALTHDALEVIGQPKVHVPADRPYTNLGEDKDINRSAGWATLTDNRFIIGQVAGPLVVVGAIVALVTDDWWLLPLSVIVLSSGAAFVLRMVFGLMSARERPSPATVALLEEEGVPDPERLFSDIVAEFTEDEGDGEERTTAVEDDPITAAAEQRHATTPTGGGSHAVVPARPPGVA